jgi:hypothetical protein
MGILFTGLNNPNHSELLTVLGPSLGIAVVEPAGSIPDFALLAEQSGLVMLVGRAGIFAAAILAADKLLERSGVYRLFKSRFL